MKKIILLFVALLMAGSCLASTFVMNKGYQTAYSEILRLRFGSAIKLIESEKTKDPQNLAHVYLLNYIDFLKVIVSEEDQSYHHLLNNKSKRLKQLEKVSPKSPWLLYSQAQVYLQSGITRVKFNDNVNAALDINKAYRLFTSNSKLFPTFKPNKAGLGLLHVLIGSIPDSYKWVTGILGMEGNVDKGLNELQSLIAPPSDNESYPFLYAESLFITTFITFNLANNETNRDIIYMNLENDYLKKELSINPLLTYGVSAFYIDQGKNEEALDLLLNRPTEKEYYQFHYLDYLTGTALMNKLDARAKLYFLKYVTQFKGRNFIKSAYQRLAWMHLIEGDFKSYQTFMSRIPLFGYTDIDSDKEAEGAAKVIVAHNTGLLKARLLFDGGYFMKAEEVLTNINLANLSNDEQLEFIYRKARVHHDWGKLDNAKVEYMQVYEKGKTSRKYYAANSLLQLASIHEKEGNNKQALWCYKTCLTLDFTEYKNSIQQKAKSGVNRLEK